MIRSSEIRRGPRIADRPRAVAAESFEREYARLSRPVRRTVAARVEAPEAVLEEACQIAWSRLLMCRETLPVGAWPSWLVTTASREAVRLNRRASRCLSLEALIEDRREDAIADCAPAADEVVDLRARLDALALLPHRQQQLVWLRGLGLSYEEMAAATGDSRRTVERQLLRAGKALRAA